MKLTKSSIMSLDVEKQIKTLREYIQSLIGRLHLIKLIDIN